MPQKKKRRFTRPTIEEMEEFKQSMGPTFLSQFTEGQLPQLYTEMNQMAELLLDIYIDRKHNERKPGSIHPRDLDILPGQRGD